MTDKFEITFLGTNGSCAYNGGSRIKYGTNTLCVAVSVGGESLIFDSGSGVCGVSELQSFQKKHLRLFYSHYHIDHISGLLFFSELFDPEKQIDLYGMGTGDKDFFSMLNSFLSPPLHPIGIKKLNARLKFQQIDGGSEIALTKGITIRTYNLSHPGNALAYRVEYDGKAFCYCTDVELRNHERDIGLLEFTHNADLLVLDSFFDTGNYKPGWGHSSWRECAEWAKQVEAKRMALFHYGFLLCDSDIDAMECKARQIFPMTFASADHMQIVL